MSIFNYPGQVELRHQHRGSGKTTDIAYMAVRAARAKSDKLVLICVPNRNMLHRHIDAIREIANHQSMTRLTHAHPVASFINGSRIKIVTQDNLRTYLRGESTPCAIFVDEATHIKDEFWNELTENLMASMASDGAPCPDMIVMYTAPAVERADFARRQKELYNAKR